MSNQILEEQKRFFEFVNNYEYINEQGRLDLEAFCVDLSMCFYCDGVLDQYPQPRETFDLLIEILETKATGGEMSLWVQRQKLIDWSPEVANVYPDGYRTYIHAAGLLHAAYTWIYNIGHTLMGISEPDSPKKYFEWIPREWSFVHAFINGFHVEFTEFQKEIDRISVVEGDYSLFEALHKSTSTDLSFEDASHEIKERDIAYRETIRRIERSIESGFNLEAITLQECLISNCLFNYIVGLGIKTKGLSFQKLLKKCMDSSNDNSGLFYEVDAWRIKRNNAIHGFIESTLKSLSESQEKFDLFSRETALEGYGLCRIVCDWYLEESINFIPTKFPDNGRELN